MLFKISPRKFEKVYEIPRSQLKTVCPINHTKWFLYVAVTQVLFKTLKDQWNLLTLQNKDKLHDNIRKKILTEHAQAIVQQSNLEKVSEEKRWSAIVDR